MEAMLQKVLGITLIIFMVGSLLEVGLKLDIAQTRAALCNRRFLFLGLLWGFVFCPGLAFLLTRIIPLAEPYAVGMLLLGMAPCAPFFPMAAQRARGDLAYVAAFMVLASVGTVILMPLLTPILIKGFSADAWTIAKPLVLFILLPLAVGVLIRRAAPAFAGRSHPVVRKVTALDTAIMTVIILWLYKTDIVNAFGSFAFGTQILFYVLTAATVYGFGFGLPVSQKSVLALGCCTRNIGAAFAPLVAVPGVDRRTIAMIAIAVPVSILCSFGAAAVFARVERHKTRPVV